MVYVIFSINKFANQKKSLTVGHVFQFLILKI